MTIPSEVNGRDEICTELMPSETPGTESMAAEKIPIGRDLTSMPFLLQFFDDLKREQKGGKNTICARVDQVAIWGMGKILPSIGNPYNEDINPTIELFPKIWENPPNHPICS